METTEYRSVTEQTGNFNFQINWLVGDEWKVSEHGQHWDVDDGLTLIFVYILMYMTQVIVLFFSLTWEAQYLNLWDLSIHLSMRWAMLIFRMRGDTIILHLKAF